MADNKVVIKINYDKKHPGITIAPQTVTVWHTRRILIALAALVSLIILLVSWWGNDSEYSGEDVQPAEKVQETIKTDLEGVAVPAPLAADKRVPAAENRVSATPETVNKIDTPKRPAAIIFDGRVIRASLNAKPKDNEPGASIKSPIKVNPNQSIETFYFSEIRSMKGKVLFHRWSRNGQMVLQKQLDLKDKISKVWSSKSMSVKDSGEWQIQLADKKGKVYSEVNFIVYAE